MASSASNITTKKVSEVCYVYVCICVVMFWVEQNHSGFHT